jgi:hypothetical protein
MQYKIAIRKKIDAAPSGLGKTLGKEAVRLGFPVLRISKATGATRQTIYNWFFSGTIAPYYKDNASKVLGLLKEAETAEKAWGAICVHFQLKA